MRRNKGKYGFVLLVLMVSLFPSFHVSRASEPEPSVDWDNRYSYTVDYGNGTHKSTFSIGPQVFWDDNSGEWRELSFQDRYVQDGYYLLENSMITAYIYDEYTVFYDPDNQRVCVDEESWVVEVWTGKKWREVDLYAPSLSYSNNDTHLTVTRNFDTSDGLFNVTYILWRSSRLKHDVTFTSRMEGDNQFRVTMKLTGIYSDKVKHSTGTETINSERHIISPFFVFGEDNNNLIFSEYLWKLGETNETTSEWIPTTLKDVILDTSAQGSKMDIIIGNYTLAENESLLIDPDSSTFYTGVGDGRTYQYGSGSWADNHDASSSTYTSLEVAYVYSFPSGSKWAIARGYFPFNTAALGDVSITSATLRLYCEYVSVSNNVGTRNFAVVQTTQASTSSIIAEDYDQCGATHGATEGAPRVVVTTTGWNTWTLDSTGLSWIIKDGWTKLGVRSGWLDVDDVTPTTTEKAYIRFSTSDSDNDPELVVIWEAAGGTEYLRDVSQGLSWGGVAYRNWDASRDFTQGFTLSSDSSRTWTLTRAFTQGITVATSAIADIIKYFLIGVSQSITLTSESLRNWDLSRSFIQGLSFASSVERLVQFVRNPLQRITASFETSRFWSLTRAFTQSLTLSSNAIADIFKVFQRTLTLGIQLGSDSFRSWTLSRSLTQGLTVSSLTDRSWSLVRFATQSLTANIEANRIFSAIRQVSQNIALSSSSGRFMSFARGLSQSITMTSESLRSWTLTRTLSLPITFSSNTFADLFKYFKRTLTLGIQLSQDSLRKWTLSRSLTQGLTVSSLTDRSWSIIRLATQSLTANIEANRIFSAIRQASQNIALSSNVGRLVSFTRGLSQSISLSSEALRKWSLSRTFTNGLSIVSSIFVKLTEYIHDPPDPEEFFRAVSMSIELASSNIRQWSLTRIFSQVISFSSNIWTKLYANLITRTATLYLTLASNTDLTLRIIRGFNIALLIFHIVPLYLSYRWLKEPYPLWSGVGGIMWFMLALLILQDNPDNYVIVRIYTLFGIIFIMLTLVSVLKQIKDVAEGRTNDDFFEF